VREYIPATGSAYPPSHRSRRLYWFGRNMFGQIPSLRKNRRDDDVTVLQRQFISTINTLERFTKQPRLLDVDDAIWLTARFGSVDKLARRCDAIICGNRWLAGYFGRLRKDVRVVPTAIDTRVYRPAEQAKRSGTPLISWIGTSANHGFLRGIESALAAVLSRHRDTQLYIVSDAPVRFARIPEDRILFEQWSEVNELRALQRMDIGLMPLDNSDWSKGKCSFKMLQYMACGVPAIVSPVGMNREVLELGGAISAITVDDWVSAMESLLSQNTLRAQLADMGRRAVESSYSTAKVAQQLGQIFQDFA
jgi:glycosyltransferase involved in cell wall biosynthesis